ncbi:hypothetical protein Cadr_000006240 [Camelus dromedarius]|uniref:Uncharacterized protein n=1 Tax=Camelus dromedarius TaxID=9838 RepID=A0A5N4E291_CAMDR|nr:hypothetical protein Cadr_000006240 [Camelus dromedarius]
MRIGASRTKWCSQRGGSEAHARELAPSRANVRASGVGGGWFTRVGEEGFGVTLGKARNERKILGALLTLKGPLTDLAGKGSGRPLGLPPAWPPSLRRPGLSLGGSAVATLLPEAFLAQDPDRIGPFVSGALYPALHPHPHPVLSHS